MLGQVILEVTDLPVDCHGPILRLPSRPAARCASRATAPALSSPPMTLERVRDALGTLVDAEMAKRQVPGVSVGIALGHEDLFLSRGITNIEHPLPVTEDTLFQVGSTTKTFTATAVMQLVEEDKADLDAPVRTHIPSFRTWDEAESDLVTLRVCLTHYGGWVGDYFRDTGRGEGALADMVARIAKAPRQTRPGTVFSYNNTGFAIAGRVVEVLRDAPYEHVVQRRILEPLGMTRSFYRPEDFVTERVAAGHVVSTDGPRIAKPWPLPRSNWAGGGLTSTARDQIAWARFQMGDGTALGGSRILGLETLAAMHGRQAEAGSLAEEVGLAWMRQRAGGAQVINHGGATNGHMAGFVMVPERRFAITVLTNADQGRDLHRAVTDWALEEVAGIREDAPATLSPAMGELSEFEGRYEAKLNGVDVRAGEGGLILQLTNEETAGADPSVARPRPEPFPVRFHAPDRVVVWPYNRWEKGEFLRDANGQVEWFRWGGRIARRL